MFAHDPQETEVVIIMSSAMPKLCGVNIILVFPQNGSCATGPQETRPLVSSAKRQPFLSNLLAANSGNKELQEAIGVHIDTHFRIRLHGINALNHVAISMKAVMLHASAPTPSRFAARKLSSGLDIYVHLLHLHQGCID